MTGDRTIKTGNGNYKEHIEGDYIHQQGSFLQVVNTREVKAEKTQ